MVRDLILRAKASPVYRMFLGRWANQRHVKYQADLVNSLYKAAFGRLAEAGGTRKSYSPTPIWRVPGGLGRRICSFA